MGCGALDASQCFDFDKGDNPAMGFLEDTTSGASLDFGTLAVSPPRSAHLKFAADGSAQRALLQRSAPGPTGGLHMKFRTENPSPASVTLASIDVPNGDAFYVVLVCEAADECEISLNARVGLADGGNTFKRLTLGKHPSGLFASLRLQVSFSESTQSYDAKAAYRDSAEQTVTLPAASTTSPTNKSWTFRVGPRTNAARTQGVYVDDLWFE